MKVLKYEKDAVLIKDGDIEAWVDVWVENEDVRTEWNKYIFYLLNDKDLAQRAWQDDPLNYDEAGSLAVEALEIAGYIYQNEEGKWFSKN